MIQKVINKLHWFFLLIFVIGYFVSRSYFDFAASEYLTFNLLAFVASTILIGRLNGFEHRNIAVWFIFTILIFLYFIRAYWIAIDPTPIKIMLPYNPYFDMLDLKFLFLDAFKISTLMFSTFCITSSFFLYFIKNSYDEKKSQIKISLRTYNILSKLLWLTIPPVVLILYFLIHHFQIGLMGVSYGEPLPFRLKGVIFYASSVVIPLLITLLIISSEKSNDKLSVNLGMLFMIAHGIVLMLLRGSRSSFLLSLLLLIFLVIVGAVKLQRNQKLCIFIFIFLAFFMVPVVTIYRNLRIDGTLILDALIQAIEIFKNDILDSVFKGIEFIFFRMPGIEALWCMLGQGARPLGHQVLNVFSSNNGVAGYLTYNIYSFEPTIAHLSAPGYVGWFYLVAGLPGVILGGVLAALIGVFGWKLTNSIYFRSKTVTQIFLLWVLFISLTDGTLDIMVLMVLSGFFCIVFMECIIYLVMRFIDKKLSK